MQPSQIDHEVIFVRHIDKVSAKTGKPVKGVLLANGRETKFFPTNLDVEAFEHLSEGETIVVEMEVDPFNDFNKKVLSIHE
jgi:hypothetical protein